jgi:hypothetical protein
MILEKRGTPDILKEIIKENYNNIQTILSNNKNYSLLLNIDKSAQLENKIVYLKCNLTINFNFETRYKYTGDINYLSIIESDFKNCIINIFLPINSRIEETLSALSHELLHLYELYQIKNIFNKTKWQDIQILDNIEKMEIYNYNSIKYFKNLFYLSLPHEIRARVTSLHFHLLSLRSNNEDILLKELEDTKEWKYFKMLENFDIDKYYYLLLKEMDVDSAINIFNFLNEKIKINFKIDTENDILNYLSRSKKYFNKISHLYKKKVNRIIKDLTNQTFEYIHHDRYILSFEELIEAKIVSRQKDIDYRNYFKMKNRTN